MSAIRSISEVIKEEAATLRGLLTALQERSRLEKRFGSEGGLTVISPTPFSWRPLGQEGRQLQMRARTLYHKSCDLMRSLLSSQPPQIRRDFRLFEVLVDQVLDQEAAMSDDDIARVFDRAFTSLDHQIELLGRLGSDTGEAQLVPDTNALLSNPSLERWRFEECPRFSLVFTPVVLGELDALKVDQRRNEGVRRKAERLIRQFGEYRRRGKVTEGVPLVKGASNVRAIAAEPDFEHSLPWLKESNNDDRLLATVIEVMRANPCAPVAVITLDMNLQNKAELANVPVLEPPQESDGNVEAHE